MVEEVKAWGQKTADFKLEANELHYMGVSGIYHSDLGAKSSKHMSIAEYVIHIWREGVSTSEMLGLVKYLGIEDVASAHPGVPNVASNVPKIPVQDVFTRTISRRMVASGCRHLGKNYGNYEGLCADVLKSW